MSCTSIGKWNLNSCPTSVVTFACHFVFPGAMLNRMDAQVFQLCANSSVHTASLIRIARSHTSKYRCGILWYCLVNSSMVESYHWIGYDNSFNRCLGWQDLVGKLGKCTRNKNTIYDRNSDHKARKCHQHSQHCRHQHNHFPACKPSPYRYHHWCFP